MAIDAIYENGVFRPVEPVELAEGERVRLDYQRQTLIPTPNPTSHLTPLPPQEVAKRLAELSAKARRIGGPESEQGNPQGICQALQETANRPLEGRRDAFSGRDHDAVLYPKTGRMP